jgi:hypothetical protein
MDPGIVEQGAATFSRTYIITDESVPSEPSGSQASWSPTPSEDFSTASPEALPPEENVAVRLIRSLTSRTSPTDDSEDR